MADRDRPFADEKKNDEYQRIWARLEEIIDEVPRRRKEVVREVRKLNALIAAARDRQDELRGLEQEVRDVNKMIHKLPEDKQVKLKDKLETRINKLAPELNRMNDEITLGKAKVHRMKSDEMDLVFERSRLQDEKRALEGYRGGWS